MSIKNVIYIEFTQINQTTFFQIPLNLEILKNFIIDQWEGLEDKNFIIEDEKHNQIKNNDDYLKFKQNKHLKLYLKIEEEKSKIKNILENSGMNYSKNNNFNFLSKTQNISCLENINDLCSKYNTIIEEIKTLKKEINNINTKLNKIYPKTESTKTNNNFNEHNKKEDKKSKEEEKEPEIKLQVSSLPQEIKLNSLINNNAKFKIQIQNCNNFPLDKGFIFSIKKNKDLLFFSENIDLFKDSKLEIGEKREISIDLILNEEKKSYKSEIFFNFTISKNDYIIDDSMGQVLITK